MINLDAYFTEFIAHNYITLTVIIGMLKVIAKETPWAADDKILQIISGLFKK